MVKESVGMEQRALTAIFRNNVSRINGLLVTRCGNRALAEELTAQTFEAAAVQYSRHRGDEVTPAWLSTVALRRLVDHWRTSERRSRLTDRILQTENHSPKEPSDRDDDVWRALDSLPENQRAAVTLRYLDDWSISEIAQGMEISYQAAESLLARGRRSFKAALRSGGGIQ